jgi:hypothetical protein
MADFAGNGEESAPEGLRAGCSRARRQLELRNLTVPRDDASRRERVEGLQTDLRTAQSPLEREKRAKRKIRPFEKLRKLCSRSGNSDQAGHLRVPTFSGW